MCSNASAAEQREHCQNATVHIWRWLETELAEDLGTDRFDRAFADHELAGDAGVRPTFGHESENLSLAWREVAER
jgi:hypothetical protein